MNEQTDEQQGSEKETFQNAMLRIILEREKGAPLLATSYCTLP